jgi:methane/ammonia monooxygenase subunit C
MSLSTETAAGAVGRPDVIVDLKPLWFGLAGLNCFYLIVRIYEQIFGWRAGLSRDSLIGERMGFSV